MAKGNTAEGIIDLKINGETAGKTINALKTDVGQLYRELNKLEAGSDAFNKKAAEVAQVQAKLDAARSKVGELKKEYAAAQDQAGKANKEMLAMSPVSGIVGEVGQKLEIMTGFVKGNVAQFGLLRTAIAATGLGALILILTSLFQWFTKTDEGAKKLEGIMNALKFVTAVLTKGIQDLGEKIFWAFTHPKEALTDLYNFVQQNLINRFTAFGVILDGIINLDFKKTADGVIQLGTGIENATDKAAGLADKAKQLGKDMVEAAGQGMALAELMDTIDERESNLLVTNAKAQEQIDRLILQAKDRTKSEAERLALLDRASVLEKNRLNDSIQLSNLKLQAAKLEFDQAAKTGNQTDEQYRKVKEAEAAVVQARTESIALQEKITNRRNALLESESQAKQKSLDEEQKKQEEFDKAQLDAARKLEDLKIALIGDSTERQIEQARIATNRQLEELAAKGVLTAEMEAALLTQLSAQIDQYNAERSEKDKADREKKFQEKIADLDAHEALELEREQIQSEATKLRLQDNLQELLAYTQAADDAEYERKRAGLLKKQQLLTEEGKQNTDQAKKVNNELLKLDLDYNKTKVENSRRTKEQLEAIERQKTAFITESFGIAAQLLSQDKQTRREYGDVIKALSTANIIIAGIEEVQEIWKNAAKIPPPGGEIYGGLRTGVAIARAGVAIAQVNKTQYESGGMFTTMGGKLNFGKRHSEGGIDLVDPTTGFAFANVERGEHMLVLRRGTYENNQGIIDALLNSSRFRNGAPIMEEGGMVKLSGSSSNPSADQVQQLTAENLAILKQILAVVSNWPKEVRAVMIYEQMKKFNAEAESIENEANAA